MVQSPPQISRQQLSEILGYSFSEKEYQPILKQITFQKPEKGIFWQSNDSSACIFIILESEVRLFNQEYDPPVSITLKAGASFGELTFFPQATFQSYSTSVPRKAQPKLAYICATLLHSLVQKHPEIQDHIFQQAQQRNFDLFGTQENINKDSQGQNFVNLDGEKTTSKEKQKISKAYFPSPTQTIGHFFQKII